MSKNRHLLILVKHRKQDADGSDTRLEVSFLEEEKKKQGKVKRVKEGRGVGRNKRRRKEGGEKGGEGEEEGGEEERGG